MNTPPTDGIRVGVEPLRDLVRSIFLHVPIPHADASLVADLLSGTLGGQMLPEFDRRHIAFRGADQSGFHMTVDVRRFTPLDAFKADVDRLMAEANRMTPLPGFAESSLPGMRAWRTEQEYLTHGIPISAGAVASLTALSEDFGLGVPWR